MLSLNICENSCTKRSQNLRANQCEQLNSNMRFYLFISLILSSICSISAQYAALDMPTEQYLNQYIIYINDNIHALRVFHKQYEKFNKDINNYYKEAPFFKTERQAYEAKKSTTLKFEVPPVMIDKAAFDPLPEDLYLSIKKQMPPNIDPSSLQILHERIDELHAIVAEIQNVSKNLEEYCINGTYLDDTTLVVGYRMLHRIQILLHDFSESKDLMYYELRRLQNGFVQPNLNNPYIRSGNKLLTFDLYARNVLVALKKGDKQAVEEQLPLMETALEDMRANAAAYTQGITNVAALDQYAASVRKSEVFVKIVREYLENPYLPGNYTAYGMDYYYYNAYFLGNYNRYGAGIIMEYNKFVDLADQPMLKMHEEPHWLIIRPKPERPDAPQKPEPEIIPKDTLPKNVIKMQAPDIKEVPKPKPEVPKDTVVLVTPPPPPPPVVEPEELAGAAPINFVFLLDVSGSMKMPYKLPILKQAFSYLISLLRPDDRVAIVLYSGNAKIALASTPCNQKDKILGAIDDLESSGESDVLKGSKLAYKVAKQNYLKDGNNRIILATDGGISISPELLSLVSQNQMENNIYLSLLYFEEKEYLAKAQKLKSISNAGKGNYSYVNAANSNESLLKEAKAVRRK